MIESVAVSLAFQVPSDCAAPHGDVSVGEQAAPVLLLRLAWVPLSELPVKTNPSTALHSRALSLSTHTSFKYINLIFLLYHPLYHPKLPLAS